MTDGYLDLPVDERSREVLAARGLDLRLVPGDDDAAFDAWSQSQSRGFLESERTPSQLAAMRQRAAERRTTGVYDPRGAEPERPVGTIASWPTELSVPGGILPSWAISSVTVAPTHHRRGIARAMMEAELRTAQALGVPMASLTVTESTLYGRYGFGPAADSAAWRLDVRRAGWIGPEASGRLDFVSRDELRRLAPEVHERARPGWPGEVVVPAAEWDGLVGTRPDVTDDAAVRAVRYTAPDGVVRGLVAYRIQENREDFSRSLAEVSYLVAEDADAYAALWRFLVELDSVAELRATELSVAEPVRWMIADQRAATVTVREHHYLRILDVRAALAGRAYGGPGVLALDVTDPTGLAGGRWLLAADADGTAEVAEWTDAEAPRDAVVVHTSIADLSSMYLGSVSLATLAAAGRVRASDPAAAARVLGWHVPARLSFWY
ncbi:GNAT family N-acetyltransferase [Microbacterium sp. X-17]|uniref:GNAT family N-acetyltransferase n=1 Tax=Microbacterium sp. X-17 TaxID=3144404 RepID=UPI0031F563D3